MGVTRRQAQTVRREDLDDSGVESIKRDTEGDVQMTTVFSSTTIGLSTTGTTTTTTKTARAFFSSATLVVTTTNSITTGTLRLSRNGSSVTQVTGISNPAGSSTSITATPTGTTNTFTLAPATWTAVLTSVGGGTMTLTTWVQSREDSRGA